MTDWRAAPAVRTKIIRFPWLLLLWWTQTKLWLLCWLKHWVQRPLMRLAMGVEDENDRQDLTIEDQQQFDVTLPYGLVNSGNLCFVNAVLQCLAAVPGFLDGVDRALRMRPQLHMVRQMDDSQSQKLLVAEALVDVLQGIKRDYDEDEPEAVVEVRARQARQRQIRDDNQHRMRHFRSATSRCTSLVSSAASRQEQQDAEEFLTFLLELLHGLLRAPVQPVRSEEEERRRFLLTEQWLLKKLESYDPNDPRSYMQAVAVLGEVRWNYFLRQNSSVITDLFSGQIVRGSQCCSCAKLTCLHEEQRVISLTISTNAGDQTLANCLEQSRHTEQLTNENRVFCDGYCQVKTARLTQTLLQRVPPVLTFRLQRFNHTPLGGRTEKIDTRVSFPCGSDELLDMKQNCFCRDTEKRADFELIAVCAHLGGSHDSGHYVAYVRHRGLRQNSGKSDQWLRIDDEIVSGIDIIKLRAETETTAYLLFYSQVAG